MRIDTVSSIFMMPLELFALCPLAVGSIWSGYMGADMFLESEPLSEMHFSLDEQPR